MKIEIIKVRKNDNPEHSVVANVHVNISEKMTAWFTIIKTKKGTLFCRPSSVKIEQEFYPSFLLVDSQKMNKLCKKVLDETLLEYNLEQI